MPLFPPGGFFSLTSRSKVHIIERLTGSSAAGSALGSGPRGREFESPLSDHERKMHLRVRLFLLLDSGTPGLLHLNHRLKAAAPRSGGAAGSSSLLSPTTKERCTFGCVFFLLLGSGTPGLLHLNHRPKAAALRSGGAAGSFPLSPMAKGKKGNRGAIETGRWPVSVPVCVSAVRQHRPSESPLSDHNKKAVASATAFFNEIRL